MTPGALATFRHMTSVRNDALRQHRMVNVCDLCRFPVVVLYYVTIAGLVPAPFATRNKSRQSMGVGSVLESRGRGKFNRRLLPGRLLNRFIRPEAVCYERIDEQLADVVGNHRQDRDLQGDGH